MRALLFLLVFVLSANEQSVRSDQLSASSDAGRVSMWNMPGSSLQSRHQGSDQGGSSGEQRQVSSSYAQDRNDNFTLGWVAGLIFIGWVLAQFIIIEIRFWSSEKYFLFCIFMPIGCRRLFSLSWNNSVGWRVLS